MKTGSATARIAIAAAAAVGLLLLGRAWLADMGSRSDPTHEGPGGGLSSSHPVAGASSSPAPAGETSATATSPPTAAAVTQEAARQLQLLDEILASKNDNDPRMDTELRVLGE